MIETYLEIWLGFNIVSLSSNGIGMNQACNFLSTESH